MGGDGGGGGGGGANTAAAAVIRDRAAVSAALRRLAPLTNESFYTSKLLPKCPLISPESSGEDRRARREENMPLTL